MTNDKATIQPKQVQNLKSILNHESRQTHTNKQETRDMVWILDYFRKA